MNKKEKNKKGKNVEIRDPEAIELIQKKAARERRSFSKAVEVTILEALGGFKIPCPGDDECQDD